MRVVLKDKKGRIIGVIEGAPDEVVYEFAKSISALERRRDRRDLIPP